MRKLKYLTLFLLLWNSVYCQDYFYYNNKERVSFTISTSSIFLTAQNPDDIEKIRTIIRDNYIVKSYSRDHSSVHNDPIIANMSAKVPERDLYWMEITSNNAGISKQDYLSEIENLKKITEIKYVAPSLQTSKNNIVLLSHLFYVELATSNNLDDLISLAEKTHTAILGRNKDLPDWYTLCANKESDGNAIEMSKIFMESGKFLNSNPDLIGSIRPQTCATDPLFSDQWNLHNTGQQLSSQTGYDIRACEAWDITTGDPNVIICPVDNGPYLQHDDYASNIIDSWNAVTGGSPSNNYTVHEQHGTNVAGILTGKKNNNIGISGVAPHCSLFPISIDYAATGFINDVTAGITHAYQNGVSIISNSWINDGDYPQLNIAINNALTLGRPINGGIDHLGCVVIFAAGNDNGGYGQNTIDYPGRTNSNVIVVGASSICPGRKSYVHHSIGSDHYSCDDGEEWGSNYGTGLDIVAPGLRITTTYADYGLYHQSTISQYISNFNGTSSATPQVAGVAALILSLFPCLRHEQVREIIDRSAQKLNLSTYTYTVGTTGEPYGSWNEEMGYGVLDAYESLNKILDFNYLQNDDITTTAEKYYSLKFIRAGRNVTTRKSSGSFTIENTANVDLKAQQYITFEPGFEAKPSSGGVMLAHIATFNSDCQNWIPTFSNKTNLSESIINKFGEDNKESTVAINEQIKMTPNPFKQSFSVSINVLNDNDPVSVRVCDLTGRLIYEYNGEEKIGIHTYTINSIYSSTSMLIVKASTAGYCKTQKMIQNEMD